MASGRQSIPQKTGRRHWEMLVVAAIVAVLACLLEVRADGRVNFVGLREYPLPHTCTSRAWFGVDCPGCGLTRSFIHLAHGNWSDSLAVHRIGWVLALAVILQFPYRAAALRHPAGKPLGTRVPQVFSYSLIALLVANWLWNLV